MSIQVLKLELMQWILLLKDIQLLNEIQKLKEKSPEKTAVLKPRQLAVIKEFLLTLRMILMKHLRVLKNMRKSSI